MECPNCGKDVDNLAIHNKQFHESLEVYPTEVKATERSKSEIQKEINKLQMFINVASFENPLNMGADQEKLSALQVEWTNATEEYEPERYDPPADKDIGKEDDEDRYEEGDDELKAEAKWEMEGEDEAGEGGQGSGPQGSSLPEQAGRDPSLNYDPFEKEQDPLQADPSLQQLKGSEDEGDDFGYSKAEKEGTLDEWRKKADTLLYRGTGRKRQNGEADEPEEKKPRPMNADVEPKITKVASNKTLIEPAEETTIDKCIICGRTADNHSNPNTDYRGLHGDAPPTDHYYEALDDGVEALATEDTSDYEVDVDEYISTGEPVQKIPEDKRAEEIEYQEDKPEMTQKEWDEDLAGLKDEYATEEDKEDDNLVIDNDEDLFALHKGIMDKPVTEACQVCGGDHSPATHGEDKKEASEADEKEMLAFLDSKASDVDNIIGDVQEEFNLTRPEAEEIVDRWDRIRHGAEAYAKEDDYPEEPCAKCGVQYKDHEEEVEDHKFVEPRDIANEGDEGKYECNTCGKKFDDQDSALSHSEFEHGDIGEAQEVDEDKCANCGDTEYSLNDEELCPECEREAGVDRKESERDAYEVEEEIEEEEKDEATEDETETSDDGTDTSTPMTPDVDDSDTDTVATFTMESWDGRVPFNTKVEAFEALGITQGDSLKLAELNWRELSIEVRGALNEFADNDKEEKRIDSQDAFNDEGDGVGSQPDTQIKDLDSIDYNIIDDNTVAREKYQCEHCNSEFKSNEALMIHFNDIHIPAREFLLDVPNSCNFCGKEIPSDVSMGEHLAYDHGISLDTKLENGMVTDGAEADGEGLKKKKIAKEAYAKEDDYRAQQLLDDYFHESGGGMPNTTGTRDGAIQYLINKGIADTEAKWFVQDNFNSYDWIGQDEISYIAGSDVPASGFYESKTTEEAWKPHVYKATEAVSYEEFKEQEHPREDSGKFTSGGGSKDGKAETGKGGNGFSIKDYRDNEKDNEHTENAYQLVKKFGTPEELKEMEEIKDRHENSEQGINNDDYKRRYEISQKYFKDLFDEYSGKGAYDDPNFGKSKKEPENKHAKSTIKDIIKSIKGGSKDWHDWGRNEKTEDAYAEIEKRNREIPTPTMKGGGKIFRDDPDAVGKMEQKVKFWEERQDYWKKVTKFPSRDYQNRNQLGDAKWYELSNIGANLRDAKKKLDGIKAQQGRGTDLVRKSTYPSGKKRFYYSEEPKVEEALSQQDQETLDLLKSGRIEGVHDPQREDKIKELEANEVDEASHWDEIEKEEGKMDGGQRLDWIDNRMKQLNKQDPRTYDEWKADQGESLANEEVEYTGGDTCATCGTPFEDRGECKKCNDESIANEDIYSELNPDNKCGMCGKTFDTRQDLEDHAYGLGPHNRTTVESYAREYQVLCQHCSLSFDLKEDLKCEYCGKVNDMYAGAFESKANEDVTFGSTIQYRIDQVWDEWNTSPLLDRDTTNPIEYMNTVNWWLFAETHGLSKDEADQKMKEETGEVKANEKGETYIFFWNHSDLGSSGRNTLLNNSGLSSEWQNTDWGELPLDIQEGLKPTMNQMFRETGKEAGMEPMEGDDKIWKEDDPNIHYDEDGNVIEATEAEYPQYFKEQLAKVEVLSKSISFGNDVQEEFDREKEILNNMAKNLGISYEVKANEDDPDFENDPDYQGFVDGKKKEPSQYTQQGIADAMADPDEDALESTEDYDYYCPICEQGFHTEQDKWAHMDTEHDVNVETIGG